MIQLLFQNKSYKYFLFQLVYKRFEETKKCYNKKKYLNFFQSKVEDFREIFMQYISNSETDL